VSDAKILFGVLLLASLAVAIFLTSVTWGAVFGLAIALAIHLASPVDDDPTEPNNPSKVRLFVGGRAVVLSLSSSG
jgi:hypothetical protein